jgi:hypothetical protein
MTHCTALSICLAASLLTPPANQIDYTVHSGDGAAFASPLIVSVAKGPSQNLVVMENGCRP